MKFSKHLSLLIEIVEELIPEWRDKFVSYKYLKKQLNKIYPKEHDEINEDDLDTRPNKRPRLNDRNENETEGGSGEEVEVVAEKEVIDFENLLEEQIKKFNDFFLDKQQDYVIRQKVVRERLAEAGNSREELMKVGREMVDFHGEMVLLENYSALNYLGLVKILKKYEKRSGARIRLPFIQKVPQEPFFRTDVLNRLVKECETMILSYLTTIVASSEASEDNEDPDNDGEASEDNEDLDNDSTVTEGEEKRLHRVGEESTESENMKNMYVRLSQLALQVLKKIRSESSTVNEFSLPPM